MIMLTISAKVKNKKMAVTIGLGFYTVLLPITFLEQAISLQPIKQKTRPPKSAFIKKLFEK